jgi:flagellar motor switch protein FliN
MAEQTPSNAPGDPPAKPAAKSAATPAPDTAAKSAAESADAKVAAAPAPAETAPVADAAAQTGPTDAEAAALKDILAAGAAPTDEANAAGAESAEATAASAEELLAQASFEDVAAVVPDGAAPNAEAFKLPSFSQVMADAQVSSIDLLRDVELNVKIELGRSRMIVEDVLKLNEGSVVELDKLAGDPVDVFVNDRLVARGEVLVLNDNFCVRVNEIVAAVKEEGT